MPYRDSKLTRYRAALRSLVKSLAGYHAGRDTMPLRIGLPRRASSSSVRLAASRAIGRDWLCRILRPALGGNTNTVVICTLNLWGGGTDDKESVATLRLGVTAKSIRNQPKRVVAEKGEAMIEE